MRGVGGLLNERADTCGGVDKCLQHDGAFLTRQDASNTVVCRPTEAVGKLISVGLRADGMLDAQFVHGRWLSGHEHGLQELWTSRSLPDSAYRTESARIAGRLRG